jgi:uncharacterized SAM-dependent methyltransferase
MEPGAVVLHQESETILAVQNVWVVSLGSGSAKKTKRLFVRDGENPKGLVQNGTRKIKKLSMHV